MAIRPNQLYPGQVQAHPKFPFGKPRNAITEGDGSGTPFEESWLSDLFGFQQALLSKTGITPNDQPDQVDASQYLDAIRALSLQDLESNGVTFHGSGTNIAGSLAVEFNCNVGQDLYVARHQYVVGNISVTGVLTGEQRARQASARRTDSSQTVPRNQVHVGTYFHGANCTWTIDGAGEQNGDWVECALGTITNTVTLRSSAGTTIATLAPGGIKYVKAMVVLGEWTVLFSV